MVEQHNIFGDNFYVDLTVIDSLGQKALVENLKIGRAELEYAKRRYYLFSKKGIEGKAEYFKGIINRHQKAIQKITSNLERSSAAYYFEEKDNERLSDVLRRHKKLDRNKISSIFITSVITCFMVFVIASGGEESRNQKVANNYKFTGKIMNTKIIGSLELRNQNVVFGNYEFQSRDKKRFNFNGNLTEDKLVITVNETEAVAEMKLNTLNNCFVGFFNGEEINIEFCLAPDTLRN